MGPDKFGCALTAVIGGCIIAGIAIWELIKWIL